MSERDEIRKVITEMEDLQVKGKYEEALNVLEKTMGKLHGISCEEFGLIHHWKGKIFYSMKDYKEAAYWFEMAISYRKEYPERLGDSTFELFLCQSDDPETELREADFENTTMALFRTFVSLDEPGANGGIFQKIGYMAERGGKIQQAILAYKIEELFRELVEGKKELALTWFRLGKCFKIRDEIGLAREYGEKALKFFKAKNDLKMIKQIKDECF